MGRICSKSTSTSDIAQSRSQSRSPVRQQSQLPVRPQSQLPDLPDDVQRAVFSCLTMDDRKRLLIAGVASDKTMPQYLHQELAIKEAMQNGITGVRITLAGYPNILNGAMQMLSIDPNPSVRVTLARNSKISPAIMQTLSTDPNHYVRAALAGNSKISPAIMQTLSIDETIGVRRSLARNSNILPEIMQTISIDDDIFSFVPIYSELS